MNNVTLFDENGSLIKELQQWDHDIIVSVSGIAPTHITAVHFANYGTKSTPDIIPTLTENGFTAKIPNELLIEAAEIFLFIYEKIGNEGARTTRKITIPVEPRPKPAGYVHTEAEFKSYEALEKRIVILEKYGTGGGTAGVYVGEKEPTDENVNVWINPNGDKTLNKWQERTINFLGDSITEGYGSTESYVSILASNIGAKCNNYGIGGSTIANGDNPMYSRVSSMDINADAVFVFGGTNDFANHNRVLGEQFIEDEDGNRTLNTDADTFYGGLNQLCINLYQYFPFSSLVLCTPLHRNSFWEQKTDLQPNAVGLYLDDYVNAIRKVAEYFGIPCLDLYAIANMYPYNEANIDMYFSQDDTLHPTVEGHRHLATIIQDFLNTLSIKAEKATIEYSVDDTSRVLEVKPDGVFDLNGTWYPEEEMGGQYVAWKLPCSAGERWEQYSTSQLGMYKIFCDEDGNFITSILPTDGSPTEFTVPNDTRIAYMWADILQFDIDNQSYKLVRHTSQKTEAILKVKDENGNWVEMPVIKGGKGEPFTYEDFTPEQLEALKGEDGVDGKDGQNGKDGVDGANGKDGYTPKKGVDYFTEVDKTEIAEQAATLVDIALLSIIGEVSE